MDRFYGILEYDTEVLLVCVEANNRDEAEKEIRKISEEVWKEHLIKPTYLGRMVILDDYEIENLLDSVPMSPGEWTVI